MPLKNVLRRGLLSGLGLSSSSSDGSSRRRPSIFTRNVAWLFSPKSNMPSSAMPLPSSMICQGWPSAVFEIQTRRTPSRRAYSLCALSMTSSLLRIITASSLFSTSLSRLYLCTPSPTITSFTSSGMSRSVGFLLCRRAISARRACSICCA